MHYGAESERPENVGDWGRAGMKTSFCKIVVAVTEKWKRTSLLYLYLKSTQIIPFNVFETSSPL